MSKIPNNKNNNTFKKSVALKEPSILKKIFIEKDKIEKMSQERILQKNVVYVIGLSYKLANKEILQKAEYFGQYGNIVKVLTNKTKGLAQNSYYENCYSSYIYYSNPVEASLAILAVDNFKIENHYLKTSFGRTKYCSYFLRNLECLNKDCFYLHKLADKDDLITGDDSKLLFHEQHIQAIKIANLLDANLKKKILSEEAKKTYETVFPKISVIYSKPVFIEFQNEFNTSINLSSSNPSLLSNGVGNNSKLSLNSIVNGNKNKDDKIVVKNNLVNNSSNIYATANKDGFVNVNGFDNKREISQEDEEATNGNNLNLDAGGYNTAKSKEPVAQGLNLADILRNEKRPKQNSPQKLKLADIINKKSSNDKKVNTTTNQQKKTEINTAQNSSTIHSKSTTPNQKIANSFSKDPSTLKKQESEIINFTNNLNENTGKPKAKLSEASNYSSEEKAINENEFNSKSSDGSSFKNPINNNEIEAKTNLDDSAKIVNNTLEEDINNNNSSCKNNNIEENKEKEKAQDLCVSPLKTNKNTSGQSTPKSKQQIILEVNKKYIKIHQEENISSTNQNKNSNNNDNNHSNNLTTKNYQKNKEANSTINLNCNSNSNHNKTSNNPELQYFMDSGKSDPRSSIISSTSCSVSPNISYNQEIENHLSNNNTINNNNNSINANSKENSKGSEFSEKRRSIYTKRDISRFDFVLNNNNININNTNNNQNDINKNCENPESRKNSDNKVNMNKETETIDEEIPEFVFDVLNKKISRFSFFKRFKNEYDIPDSIFLEDSFIDKNKDESWADFIKMNLNP